MSYDKQAMKAALKREAEALGFVAFGVTGATSPEVQRNRLSHWLAVGAHGELGWMEDRADQRSSPDRLWPDAKSVIMLGMSYAPATNPLDLAAATDRARISAYAQGKDYHDVVKKALKALARWLVSESGAQVKVFVDTAPVMEKPLGQRAGIGWQGKHSNLVSRTHGSWLFLGAIFTTLALEPDRDHADQCGSCTACQTACPTQAFPAPYTIDARRCISYLTIEHKGPIPHEFWRAMGNRIYGCDDCLAVCPWNKFAQTAATNRAFLPRAELAAPRLADLLRLDDAGFRTLFSGSPVKRIGRDRFVRNVAIAAGNSGDKALVPTLTQLTDDACETVAEAARWALAEIANPPQASGKVGFGS